MDKHVKERNIQKIVIGRATLYHADCLEIIPYLKASSAVVTDPPYGINYHHGGRKNHPIRIFTDRIIGDDKPFNPQPFLRFQKVLFFGANYFAANLPPGEWLCWDKSCGCGPNDSFRDAEFMWMNTKSSRTIWRQIWKGMIREGEEASSKMVKLHVSQKPVALMMWCIEQLRVKNDGVVIDPYMGSGSTGIAALRSGREFIGIEISETIFKVAVDRIKHEIESNQ